MSKNDTSDYGEMFARYYDVLTRHKNYEAEVNHLLDIFARFRACHPYRVLSVGCGIGAHERLLAPHCGSVQGVDKSPSMIRYGRRPDNPVNLSLDCAADVRLESASFDCVISLFNVVNCVESLDEVCDFFLQAAGHLRYDGLYIFEVWNADEIRRNPPTIVAREYKDENLILNRTVTPRVCTDKHLELTYCVEGRDGDRDVFFESVHPIFLYSMAEIESALDVCGFEHVEWFTALSEGAKSISPSDRMLLCKAQKRR